MLTTVPKVGDLVLLTDKNDNRRMRCESHLLPVDHVGTKYLTITRHGRPKKFPFTGLADNYELWHSQEAYDRHQKRDRSIGRIKKVVSSFYFGEDLSDEVLEQILNLIEVKS